MKHNYITRFLFSLLTGVLLLPALPTHAAERNSLRIFFADGTSTSIQLFTRPRVTFEGDRVCVRSSVIDLSYPASDVLKFHYRVNGLTVGADEVEATPDLYRQEGESITFDKSITDSSIQLYTEDGKRVPAKVNRTAGRPSLSLTSLPAGIYVLSVNGRTSKFVKR